MTAAAVTPLRDAAGPTAKAVPERVPPRNLEAEQALLGAVLMNNRAYERVADFLRPEHFSDPANGKIFKTMGVLIDRGDIADVTTLKHLFERDDELAQIGGIGYLARLAGSAITIINAADYGRTIFDAHIRRQLIDIGDQITAAAYGHSDDLDAKAQVDAAEQRIFELASTGSARKAAVSIASAAQRAVLQAEQAIKYAGRLAGITTGLVDLDAKLGGLRATDLILLAARPSAGKTALATNIAYRAARALQDEERASNGAGVAFFSLEMSDEQLAARVIADMAGVPSDRIHRGAIDSHEFSRLVQAEQDLRTLPIFIDDTTDITIGAIRSKARQLKRQHKIGLVVVDYLQLVRVPARSKSENRVQEITEISAGLKGLAKELQVPVLALSQLSRGVESRENKRPMLSDLRESGALEQDADVVMFLYREEYYLRNAAPTRKPAETTESFNDRTVAWEEAVTKAANLAEIIIAKNRKGPTATVNLHFDGALTRFSDLARGEGR